MRPPVLIGEASARNVPARLLAGRSGRVLCLLSVLLIFVGVSSAEAHRHCLGHRVTISGPNAHLKSHGRRVILGTKRHDVIAGTRRSEWIVGNGGRDFVCGGGGRDVILVALGHHAQVSGGRGSDYVDGSSTSDQVAGGPGNDHLYGEPGGDQIDGGPGNDLLRSSLGNDRLRGGLGNDEFQASSGRDTADGGSGDDTISTGPSADVVHAGPGDDLVHLLEGDDRGFGGTGDDQVGGFNGNDHIYGGPGRDLGNGGYGRDAGLGFETYFDLEGPGVPLVGLPIPHLRRLGTRRAIAKLARYKRRLTHMRAVRTNREVALMYARRTQHGDAAKRLVDKHFKRRRRHHPWAKASLLRSEELHRVRLLLNGVSDQIDRLVIARAAA